MDRYDEMGILTERVEVLNNIDPFYKWMVIDKVRSKWFSKDTVVYKLSLQDKFTHFINETEFESFDYIRGPLDSRINCLNELPLEIGLDDSKENPDEKMMDIEKDFCFDVDVVKDITYETEELFDDIKEAFDYLYDNKKSSSKNKVKFLDFEILNDECYHRYMYSITLNGIMIGRLYHIIPVGSSDERYYTNVDYPEQMKYFVYAVKYILDHKRLENEKLVKENSEKMNRLLKTYEC